MQLQDLKPLFSFDVETSFSFEPSDEMLRHFVRYCVTSEIQNNPGLMTCTFHTLISDVVDELDWSDIMCLVPDDEVEQYVSDIPSVEPLKGLWFDYCHAEGGRDVPQAYSSVWGHVNDLYIRHIHKTKGLAAALLLLRGLKARTEEERQDLFEKFEGEYETSVQLTY